MAQYVASISRAGIGNCQFKRVIIRTRSTFQVFFVYLIEPEASKKPPYLPQSNVTVENRMALEC